MKNKIEFPKNDVTQTRQRIHQKVNSSEFDQNNALDQSLRTFKIVNGKVKMQSSNNGHRFDKYDRLDDNEELVLVWKRMRLFLKITFLFLLLFSLYILIQKNIL